MVLTLTSTGTTSAGAKCLFNSGYDFLKTRKRMAGQKTIILGSYLFWAHAAERISSGEVNPASPPPPSLLWPPPKRCEPLRWLVLHPKAAAGWIPTPAHVCQRRASRERAGAQPPPKVPDSPPPPRHRGSSWSAGAGGRSAPAPRCDAPIPLSWTASPWRTPASS